MTFRIAHLLKLFLLFSLILLLSCAINPVTGKKELMLVSEDQELAIGREAAPSMKWEFNGQYHDRRLKSYLEKIVIKLWKDSERPHLPMEFYIQNTSVPNAFALPGYVAITRGLLSDLENEAEFAAIIGHEIGHVMARHTAQKISRISLQQLGLAIGATVLKDKSGRDTLLTLGAVSSNLLLLKYDRNQEIQADRLGVKYMAMLGYDPKEALSAHKALERSVDKYLKRLGKSRGEDSFISELLSTHPGAETRLSAIREMINELPSYRLRGDGRFSKRFQSAIKDIREVNRVYFIYDKAEEHYKENNFDLAKKHLREAIRLNNSQAPFHNLMGFIRMQQKDYAKAGKAFRVALSIDPDYQPSIYGSGLISYFEGNYNQAIRTFKKGLKLYPNHALTNFGIGKSYLRLNKYSKAISYLGNFAAAAPGNPEVHGLLGICYETIGKIRPAVRQYRYQIQVAPDTKLGRHAKKRLAALEPLVKP